jgi:hypothetical protein
MALTLVLALSEMPTREQRLHPRREPSRWPKSEEETQVGRRRRSREHPRYTNESRFLIIKRTQSPLQPSPSSTASTTVSALP